MTARTTTTEAPRVLSLRWTLSKAADTYGYNALKLTDTRTKRGFRAVGGGYDMEGTVFAEWLTAAHPERLEAIAGRAFNVYTPGRGTDRADIPLGTGLYGLTRTAGTSDVRLDGACGLSSMLAIAEAAGLEVHKFFSNRGRLSGFTVAVAAATEGGAA
jgi:hypothetical protein